MRGRGITYYQARRIAANQSMDDHLLPLPVATAGICNTDDLNSSDESDVEVCSEFDEDVSQLIDMSIYLRVNTIENEEDDDDSGNEEFALLDPHPLPESLVFYSMISSDKDDLCVAFLHRFTSTLFIDLVSGYRYFLGHAHD